jgi:hypothetical protein
MPWSKLWGAKRCIEMEDHAMSLSRNGHAVSTRGAFLGALFSSLLALAPFNPGAVTAQEVKQIKLTEKHIRGFMAASKDMAQLYSSADQTYRIRRSRRRRGLLSRRTALRASMNMMRRR